MRRIHEVTSSRVNRRRFMQALGSGAMITGALPLLGTAGQSATPVMDERTNPGIRVYPAHGSRTASPGTEISFRETSVDRLGPIRVSGSRSGGHSGVIMPHQDGRGNSFVPDAPFAPGEEVTVTAGIPLQGGASGSVVFTTAIPGLPAPPPDRRTIDAPEVEPHTFVSRPDLSPPVIDVVKDTGNASDGLIFLTPAINGGQSGVMIIDDDGEVVWFSRPEIDLSQCADFKVQALAGQPVLTWWQGARWGGTGMGHWRIVNTAYEQVAALQVGNGYQGGTMHEFIITSRDTALVAIYAPVVWDLRPYGGAEDGLVLDSVIQELEIGTGRVLFEWHAWDHIDVDESYQGIPEEASSFGPFDYVHLNSIDEDEHGDLYASLHGCNCVIKIDRATGEVVWRLGGKRGDFGMGEGSAFSFQHDARMHPGGLMSIFDNVPQRLKPETVSRGLILQLDTAAMTAGLVQEFNHPQGKASYSQGNIQVLDDGNVFIGWGSSPWFTEFDASGEVVWSGQIPGEGQSYRAFRFEWPGMPSAVPDLAVRTSGGTTTLYASWNGATGVASWRVLAGTNADSLSQRATVARDGFETEIPISGTDTVYAVQAMDANDGIMATSRSVTIQ